MQVNGILTIKDRVLAEDATTHDVYDSIEVDFKLTKIVMPRPLFLNKFGKDGKSPKRLGIIFQYTSSGSWDMKLDVLDQPESSEEELIAAAKEKVKADRLKVANPEEVDEESDEFKEALKEIKKSVSKTNPEDFVDPVLAKLDDDGKPVANKDSKG